MKRCSPSAVSSSTVSASGSFRTPSPSASDTPCFLIFAASFFGSNSADTRAIYARYAYQSTTPAITCSFLSVRCVLASEIARRSGTTDASRCVGNDPQLPPPPPPLTPLPELGGGDDRFDLRSSFPITSAAPIVTPPITHQLTSEGAPAADAALPFALRREVSTPKRRRLRSPLAFNSMFTAGIRRNGIPSAPGLSGFGRTMNPKVATRSPCEVAPSGTFRKNNP